MEETKVNSFLETERIGRLMRKFSLPCIISLLVGALYNIVDQIFIANADYLGSFGNAANSIVFPLTVIALAIATMIGDGCGAFVSIRLGAKDFQKAHKSIGNSVLLTVASSIVLMVIYLIFADRIITAFGGTVNEEAFRLSKDYFFWISLGVPFYMFGQALNPIIRSDGNPPFCHDHSACRHNKQLHSRPDIHFQARYGHLGCGMGNLYFSGCILRNRFCLSFQIQKR